MPGDIFGGIAIIVVLYGVFTLGELSNSADVKFDCVNYGKTKVGSTWYQCSVQESKP